MFVTGNFHQGREKVLTGEAAGFLHMNGAGIDTAIDSGYRVGAAISEALKHNRKPGKPITIKPAISGSTYASAPNTSRYSCSKVTG